MAALVLGEYRRLGGTPVSGPRLTDRETEVLRFVAKGLTYREIGGPPRRPPSCQLWWVRCWPGC
ncbi:hypothetical protein GCM10027176_75710 [Actinoallomurus bryophytorum]